VVCVVVCNVEKFENCLRLKRAGYRVVYVMLLPLSCVMCLYLSLHAFNQGHLLSNVLYVTKFS